VRSLGAIPIDYKQGRLDTLMKRAEPGGVDFVFDAVGGANIGACIGSLRRGGMVVGFGFMGAAGVFTKIVMFANLFVGSRLRGRRGDFYGISALYRKDPKPFQEDMPKIFELLREKKIDPVIKYTFPQLEARKAIELLISGAATGKIILTDGTER
jgi:NADPH:quinone reductase-like Zn-dependent oxidoreductase